MFLRSCLLRNYGYITYISRVYNDALLSIYIHFSPRTARRIVFDFLMLPSTIVAQVSFYRVTACNATHGIAVRKPLSVCSSVRQTRELYKTKESSAHILTPHKRSFT